MSYESIAKLVHDLAKNHNRLSGEHGLPVTEMKTDELTIIQKVFSNYEISGDTLSIGVIPDGLWA